MGFLPKSVAQLAGMLVTGIVAFGSDIEVYYAVPMGVFAGALASFCVSLSEAKDSYRRREAQEQFRARWEHYK
ncbi:MAG: hypothetical protein BGN82_01830 [Alphaproteobacteria bacterium 65-7]|nr:MAG: hypothetical protein BGN82_01830 [Alphaproteobacteria bacterium 65-7]